MWNGGARGRTVRSVPEALVRDIPSPEPMQSSEGRFEGAKGLARTDSERGPWARFITTRTMGPPTLKDGVKASYGSAYDAYNFLQAHRTLESAERKKGKK